MSELRQDPTTRTWVIVATERARRPDEFKRLTEVHDRPSHRPDCPFCSGNEALTPKEVWVHPDPQDWQVRVVPNKFPALVPEGVPARQEFGHLFRQMAGFGAHEVIIETPNHAKDLPDFTLEETETVLRAYRARYQALRQEAWARFIVIFRNHGLQAGTSLEHPHSQLIATPVAPLAVRQRYEVAMAYYDDRGGCLYRDLVEAERQAGLRVVLETERFVAFEPYASQTPFETWIAPKIHRPSFGLATDEDLHELAPVLRSTLRALALGLGDPDYNYVVASAPVEDEHKAYYLWHLRIVPRLTTPAGFELGSGIGITTARPEDTAAFLRNIIAYDTQTVLAERLGEQG
ncbi:MAG: galactose-1-phosphate uridylyltransferase [Chloroflexi bacterium]|nr:galactose-1-phosphate uridylyltransferase [Chloroflexota bacterium]